MEEEKRSLTIARLAVSAALFVAALLVPDETVSLVLNIVAYIAAGWDVVFEALKNIVKLHPFDECFLMTLATAGAFATGEYGEAVAVMFLYRLGEMLTDIAVERSRKSVLAISKLRPDHATVIRDGQELSVAPEEVAVGETIAVKPGERVPLDGYVVSGASSLDTSALTGEALPVDVNVGDSVMSGVVNLTSPVHITVTGVYGESTVAKILRLVEESEAKKAPSESFIRRFSAVYTPVVVLCAVLLAAIPPLAFGLDASEWIHRALIFLVVSCPCALVISVPLTFFCAIGRSAKCGILFKSSQSIETLAKADVVVFDKTGTLTKGVFRVTAIHPTVVSESELLSLAASAERDSLHPIARSLVDACGENMYTPADVTEYSGLGLVAVINGKKVGVGNGGLMNMLGAQYRDCHRTGTIVHVCVDGEYMGHIVINDEVKDDSAATVGALRSLGVRKTVMFTGDNEQSGKETAGVIGIDEVHAKLLPADKASLIETVREGSAGVVFVGDGINDAPVLTASDVGIAMGALGSDAAIEASDVVLTQDRLSGAAAAKEIAVRAMRTVRFDIVFALVVKSLILVLGALGLTGMWSAVFADVGVTLIAVLVSTLSMARKPKSLS